jgi:magnesium transporter
MADEQQGGHGVDPNGAVVQDGLVIVDCALYRDGSRVEETHNLIRLAAMARREDQAFVWMGMLDPTETDLVGASRVFGLHQLAVEDAVVAHQRPKVDAYDDHLFVVLRTLTYDEPTAQVETGEIAVFVGSDFVVTVRHGSGQELTSVRSWLEDRPDVLAHGPSAVLYAVADAVVDTYLDVATQLQLDVDEIESRVFDDEVSDDSSRIYNLKREVLEFRRAVVPLVTVIGRLHEGRTTLIPDGAKPFFRDVGDHVLRVAEQLESMDLLLTNILQAHLAQVGVRQNEDMRKITAWAAIFAVQTLIVGVYGMNFRHMPELEWRYGYGLVLLLMVGVAFGLHRGFRRAGWL